VSSYVVHAFFSVDLYDEAAFASSS
jgi:hypothetical protein